MHAGSVHASGPVSPARRIRVAAPACAGFTLIELLAVLTITALAGALVLLTLPGAQQDLTHDAERLARVMAQARGEAILGLREIEVAVTAQGYRVRRREQAQWRALDAAAFAMQRWAPGVSAVLPAAQAQISVRFDPTGAATAQRIALTDTHARVHVAVGADGRVRIDGAAR